MWIVDWREDWANSLDCIYSGQKWSQAKADFIRPIKFARQIPNLATLSMCLNTTRGKFVIWGGTDSSKKYLEFVLSWYQSHIYILMWWSQPVLRRQFFRSSFFFLVRDVVTTYSQLQNMCLVSFHVFSLITAVFSFFLRSVVLHLINPLMDCSWTWWNLRFLCGGWYTVILKMGAFRLTSVV